MVFMKKFYVLKNHSHHTQIGIKSSILPPFTTTHNILETQGGRWDRIKYVCETGRSGTPLRDQIGGHIPIKCKR